MLVNILLWLIIIIFILIITLTFIIDRMMTKGINKNLERAENLMIVSMFTEFILIMIIICFL